MLETLKLLNLKILLNSVKLPEITEVRFLCNTMRHFSFFESNMCLYESQEPSKTLVRNQLTVCVAYSLLILAIVVLNGLSIITITRCSQLDQKACYFVILLQSAVDMTFGLLRLPLRIAFILDRDILRSQNVVICWLYYTIGYYPTPLSLLMLCGLSFERYLGVLHPLLHRKQVTKERLKKYLCFATLFSISFSISTIVFGDKNYTVPTIVFAISILFCFLFYLFVYTRIFLRAKYSLYPRRQKGLVFPVETAQTNATRMMWKRRFIKEFELAKSCFLVVCTFGLCFLPSIILFTPLNLDKDTNLIAWSWAIFLAGFNCCLNSMIFFWSKAVFRKEAEKVLKICCGYN